MGDDGGPRELARVVLFAQNLSIVLAMQTEDRSALSSCCTVPRVFIMICEPAVLLNVVRVWGMDSWVGVRVNG